MGSETKIQWCDSTVNFWSGCTKVSAGCAHCYAEGLSKRDLPNVGKWGKGQPRKLHESAFKMAVRLNARPWVCDECGAAHALPSGFCACSNPTDSSTWATRHRRRIFSLSLGDWLDAEVHIEWLARMLDTVRLCEGVDWILCTKRPELWRSQLQNLCDWRSATGEGDQSEAFFYWIEAWLNGKAPKHIWLLTSVENQSVTTERIAALASIPAVVRGLSLEPLLGPVDLSETDFIDCMGHPNLQWLIIGGESGNNARSCDLEWVRSLVNQGTTAGVATFVKQLGKRVIVARTGYGEPVSVNLDHPKGGDWNEWPAELRVRQFPQPR